MDERCPEERLRMAGGIRRLYDWNFTEVGDGDVYPISSRTSSQAEFSRGIPGLPEKARRRIRPALCVGLKCGCNFMRPYGTRSVGRADPALKRRAIVRCPSGAIRSHVGLDKQHDPNKQHSSTGVRSNSGSGLSLVSRSQVRDKRRGAMSENGSALRRRVSPEGHCVPGGRLKGSARTHDQLWQICVVGEGAWGNFQQGIQVFFEAAPHCFINVFEAERLQTSLRGPHGKQHFRLAAHRG